MFGGKVQIVGFAINKNIKLDDAEFLELYQNALEDYEEILANFNSETYDNLDLGEEALYNKIELMAKVGQNESILEFCDEFKEKYSQDEKRISDFCKPSKISNSKISTRYVMINGKAREISLEGVYEPNEEDFSAKILIKGPNGESSSVTLLKNSQIDLDSFRTEGLGESIKLMDIKDENTIKLKTVLSKTGGKVLNTQEREVKLDSPFSIEGYTFSVTEINLVKSAKVSVRSNVKDGQSSVDFNFKIGIEKRAIQLAPDKINQLINQTNSSIAKFQKISDALNKTNTALQSACTYTAVGLVAYNLLNGISGESIARSTIMRGASGWYERCKGNSEGEEACLLGSAEDIEKEVNVVAKEIESQNTKMKELENNHLEADGLDKSVSTTGLMQDYSKQVRNTIANLGTSFSDPNGEGEDINIKEIQTILGYESWQEGNYNLEQAKEIELYSGVLQNNEANADLKTLAKNRLYSIFSELKKENDNYGEKAALYAKSGIPISHMLSVGGKGYERFIYQGDTAENLGLEGVAADAPVVAMQSKTENGKFYYVLLKDTGGKVMPVDSDEQGLMVYDDSGKRVAEGSSILQELKTMYFERSTSEGYNNKYKNPEVRYYETEPYKGQPAVAVFDKANGWYAATKQTVPVMGNIPAFDESGRLRSFWLCNVGDNGMEEFISGDDVCKMIDLLNEKTYEQFPGIDNPAEVKKLVDNAVKAVNTAKTQYEAGIKKIAINGEGIDVGRPAAEISEIRCQDFMSPKECQLLFNVCDPVVCPSSRCDLGGVYPVKDVVQSGIIGSIMLCLPNFKEGIFFPVCLTGVQAGIDAWLSVQEAYRDCLQTALDKGETVGVCDELNSMYICDFFWRQLTPVVKAALPNLISTIFDQGAKGGGEYMFAKKALDNARSSMDYFTNYYGKNVLAAFEARTMEKFLGDKFCKAYPSVNYPNGADVISSITEPSSPPQFYGRFDEISFTSVTVPPTSQYKVYYHIFAGKNSGAYYRVYLEGDAESYYQDTSASREVASGYIAVGKYASETVDFTSPSGYSRMCIRVNDYEECGFKQVSTSAAVDFINDKYMEEQASQKEITTEAACISGTISLYSIFNINPQSMAENAINPALYSKGIVRVCATENPGRGTDAYAGMNNSRWVEVGYCGEENIRCYIDTESIKDAIISKNITDETLTELSKNYLDILGQENQILSDDEFSGKVEEIKKANETKKISLVNGIIERVYMNSQKAYLLLLRRNAYSNLAKLDFAKKAEARAKAAGQGTSEEASVIRSRILAVAKAFADKGYDETRIDVDGNVKKDKVCATFVSHVLVDAGVKAEGISWSKDAICSCNAIDVLISIFESNNNFVEVNKNNLQQGDMVILGYKTERTQHITIFSYYSKDKKSVNVYGDPGDRKSDTAQLETYTINGDWYVYRAFRYTGGVEELKAEAEAVAPEEHIDLDTAIAEAENKEGTYSESAENKKLIDGLYDEKLITKEEHSYLQTKGTMEELQILLESKKIGLVEAPIFEYKDGRIATNLYYKYTNKWYWSSDSKNWIPAPTGGFFGFLLKGDNKEFIQKLGAEDYAGGLKLLIQRLDADKGRLIKPSIHTEFVDMDVNKQFTYKYNKNILLFRFVNNKWQWKINGKTEWGYGACMPAGSCNEPAALTAQLESEDFYGGAEMIFYVNKESPGGVIPSLVFEYKDGGVSDYYYKYENNWYSSPDNKNWLPVPNVEFFSFAVPEDDKNFIESLEGKSYLKGLELMINRMVKAGNSATIHTEKVDMDYTKKFTYRYDGMTFYFKYTNGWVWQKPDARSWNSEVCEPEGDCGEPIRLISELKGREFEEGVGILFYGERTSYEDVPEVADKVVETESKESAFSKIILDVAKEFESQDYDEFRLENGKQLTTNVDARFISHVLVDAGVAEKDIEWFSDESCSCDNRENLVSTLEANSNFLDISIIDGNNLQAGDIVVLSLNDKKIYEIGIFANYIFSPTKKTILMYADPGSNKNVTLQSIVLGQTPNNWSIYEAFRYDSSFRDVSGSAH
ncbi:MAG: hypothetical protein WC238_05885 [Parcubacteria group bacterium]